MSLSSKAEDSEAVLSTDALDGNHYIAYVTSASRIARPRDE